MVMIESFPHKINSTHIRGLSNCPSLVLLRQIVGTLIHPQPRHHFHSPCCRWTEGLCRNAWPFRDLKAMSTSLVLRLGPGEECGEVLLYLQELYQNTDFIFLYLLFLTPGGLLSFSFLLGVPAHIAAAFLGVILPSWLKLIRIKIHTPPKKKTSCYLFHSVIKVLKSYKSNKNIWNTCFFGLFVCSQWFEHPSFYFNQTEHICQKRQISEHQCPTVPVGHGS